MINGTFLISVIIPVYNQPHSLYETLISVSRQTYRNMEVLVVDDGSDCDINKVVQEVKDVRIRYYRLEHNNANVARNYGIILSQGQYVALLDADDIWLDTHLEECLETLQASSADGLYGSLIIKNIISGEESVINVDLPSVNETMINYLLRSAYGAQTSTLFLSALSVKDILWDPTLSRHQDYDFVVRYSKKYTFTVKDHPTVIYYKNSELSNINFYSCMKVIEANSCDIMPSIYNAYHKDMFLLARKVNASQDIIKYYRKEAMAYKEYVSYVQYINFCKPRNRYESLFYKLKYLIRIIQVKVQL